MTATIWQSLFSNLAVISLILVAWGLLSDSSIGRRLSKSVEAVLLGAIMAAGTVASMAMATPMLTGFIFDLRAPLIAASAYFGGLPAMLVTAAVAIAYRLQLGGDGAIPGAVGIVIAAAIGFLFWWKNRSRDKGLSEMLAFALAVAAGSLVTFLVYPSSVWFGLLKQNWLPLVTLVSLSSVMIAFLLSRQLKAQELANTNMIYRAMVDELPDPINVKDVEGRFMIANPATAALMRAASVEALIGKSDQDFYPPDLAETFQRDESDMLKSGATRRIEQIALFPDGSRGWHDTLKAPLRDEDGQTIGIITYNRNITEQKRVSQLKNEFISTVSHELRTPLTSIRGSLGLIAAGVTGDLPAKAANLIKIAHSNSERLVHLINDILDMEKIESGKMAFDIRAMPIRPILEQAIAGSANYKPERRVQVVLLDDAPRAQAMVDADRLHQVVTNLLSNAIKFSPVAGVVSLAMERREKGHLRISVSDRGSGIPEAFQGRIFGKFEQADASSTRDQGGTGLGLSIAKAIVERLGGVIGFHDRDGGGTVFFIDLAESGPIKSATHLAPEDARGRILVCEDESDIAAVIATMLDVEGFASDVAPDIASAKSLLKTRKYVAVTLDIKLAGESGLDLFRDIRSSSTSADVPVIVISAVLDDAMKALNGAAIGIVDWLEKPVDPQRLHGALAKIVAARADRRPRILHVEDDDGVLGVIAESLGAEVSITPATSLKEANELLAQGHFDLVVLDVILPDGSGLDLLPDLPADSFVILFSAVEVDREVGAQVKAVLTKTKASELDVARLIRGLLPAAHSDRDPVAAGGGHSG